MKALYGKAQCMMRLSMTAMMTKAGAIRCYTGISYRLLFGLGKALLVRLRQFLLDLGHDRHVVLQSRVSITFHRGEATTAYLVLHAEFTCKESVKYRLDTKRVDSPLP